MVLISSRREIFTKISQILTLTILIRKVARNSCVNKGKDTMIEVDVTIHVETNVIRVKVLMLLVLPDLRLMIDTIDVIEIVAVDVLLLLLTPVLALVLVLMIEIVDVREARRLGLFLPDVLSIMMMIVRNLVVERDPDMDALEAPNLVGSKH